MATAFDEALRMALTLSPEERVRLLERVGSRLPEDDEGFVAELNRRAAELDAGAPGVPADVVHAELDAVLDGR